MGCRAALPCYPQSLPELASSWGRAEAAGEAVTVLRVQRQSFEVNGKPASRLMIAQPDGTQGLITAVGQQFRARVENELDVPTLIHWHGLAPPWQQDGVPEVSSPPIAPGASADYDFPLDFGGTFWMHSHQGLQEQELLAAPLIIRDDRDRRRQQEVVVMLADFSFTPPEQIYAALRKPATGQMAMGGRVAGMSAASAAPDLNDVKYDDCDRTLADPEVIRVETGGMVLLRVINSSSMSAYHVDLGGLIGERSPWTGSACRRSAAAAFLSLSRSSSISARRSRTTLLHIRYSPPLRVSGTNPGSYYGPEMHRYANFLRWQQRRHPH